MDVLDKNTDWYRHGSMNEAQRTRPFIFEKTAPLFNAKGYAGTSLADMTQAPGSRRAVSTAPLPTRKKRRLLLSITTGMRRRTQAGPSWP
ncbi:hypothetical protein K2O51_33300 (plasmid) [Cupriavidus pinatubonensis]|uniref:hypothetical protein n=1 Tax=Cupriavidus pinatubonensis TaxID=248026 RepID=UPI001C72F0F1|nr:hypothetical protein [Cupriavidus pinatubonensis]QYY34227.1 hypothetical protein K2O51_33300 [Cupriavidus pinatubonensis]